MKKILEILSVKFQFLVVKFSIYLNRRVFVMIVYRLLEKIEVSDITTHVQDYLPSLTTITKTRLFKYIENFSTEN